jgi:hypothetical protein
MFIIRFRIKNSNTLFFIIPQYMICFRNVVMESMRVCISCTIIVMNSAFFCFIKNSFRY